MPPLLKPDGSLTHCPKEKATLFANVFDGKQSDEILTLPQSCHPEAKLRTIAFRSREIERLMLDLDPYGGSGPDGIFPLFFIKTAHFLAPKIAVIFRKLTRAGKFTCVGGEPILLQLLSQLLLVLVPQTIDQFLLLQFCLRFLKACWLSA